MNKQRLQGLANLLRQVPKEKFNLDTWRYTEEATNWEDVKPHLTDDRLKDPECGTTGCAVGWACSHKPFQDEGLVWNNTPTYMHWWGWDAVNMFFELDTYQGRNLFDTYSYTGLKRTPGDVADRIEKFLKEA